MKNREGIAVAGSIIVDSIHDIDAFPSCGELTEIIHTRKAVGGCVPNVAVDLKRISPRMRVSAIGRIGDDENGKFVAGILEKEGVDISGLSVSDGESTGFTEVMSVVDGQRTFFAHMGANGSFGLSDMDLDALQARILHLGYFLLLKKVDEEDGIRILKKAQEAGVETSIDMISKDTDHYQKILPCLKYTDYLIINEYEAGKLSGMEPADDNLEKIAAFLKEQGFQKKVIIHKPECSVCLSSEEFTRASSYQLPEGFIKGTTGAGDAFCAGALTAIYNGEPDEQILDFASRCAVMSLKEADATSGVTDEEHIREYCSRFVRQEA